MSDFIFITIMIVMTATFAFAAGYFIGRDGIFKKDEEN